MCEFILFNRYISFFIISMDGNQSIDHLLCLILIILTSHILSTYFRNSSFFTSFFFPDEIFLPALTTPPQSLPLPLQPLNRVFGVHFVIHTLAAGNTKPTNLILHLSKEKFIQMMRQANIRNIQIHRIALTNSATLCQSC